MKERRLLVARRGDDVNALAFPHSLAKPKKLILKVREEGRPCVSLISRQFSSGRPVVSVNYYYTELWQGFNNF